MYKVFLTFILSLFAFQNYGPREVDPKTDEFRCKEPPAKVFKSADMSILLAKTVIKDLAFAKVDIKSNPVVLSKVTGPSQNKLARDYLRYLAKHRERYNHDQILSPKFSTVNPSDGWFSITVSQEKWLEPNNEFIEIIPHISKKEFEIHIYRDKDNILKALISSTFSKNVILKYKDLERLKEAPNHPEHEIKMTWYNGENKLYIDGVLVDVHPKDVDSSFTQLEEGVIEISKSDGDVFRALNALGPENGAIGFFISKEDWLENNGEYISIFPHIFISEQNFEVHGYRDKDYVLRFLISTSHSKNVILEFSDLGRLKEHPEHPNHFIQIVWNKEKKKLYVDEGDPVDAYPKER